jgi:hypothetical protein
MAYRGYQATPAARRRLAERGYTRDAIPTIDDGPHVHIHTYDEDSDECADLLDRVDHLEKALAQIISQQEDPEEPPDDSDYNDAVLEPGLTSGM